MNNETTNNNANANRGDSTNKGAAKPNQGKHKKPYWKYKKKKNAHKPGVGQDNSKNTAHKKNWNNKNKQFKSKINIPTHYLKELEKIAQAENSTITDVTLDAVKQYILEKDKAKNTTAADNSIKPAAEKSPSLFKRLFGLK